MATFFFQEVKMQSPDSILEFYRNKKKISNNESIILQSVSKLQEKAESFELSDSTIKKKHTHFAFNDKDDVTHIQSILESHGYTHQRNAFLDIYFDTPDLKLMKLNQWLRFRDGKWNLKIIELENLDIFFRYFEDSEVLMKLNEMKYPLHDETNHYLQKSMSALEKNLFHPVNEIKRICPRIIASFATNRLMFTHESDDIEISIDTIKINNQEKFYSVGHIKSKYDSNASEQVMNLIKDYIRIPSRSKIITVLINRNHKDDDIAEVLDNIIQSKLDHVESAFEVDPFPLIPYDKLDLATQYAIGSELPILTAYMVVKEEEIEKEHCCNESNESDESDESYEFDESDEMLDDSNGDD